MLIDSINNNGIRERKLLEELKLCKENLKFKKSKNEKNIENLGERKLIF